jgi:hypothetical protein
MGRGGGRERPTVAHAAAAGQEAPKLAAAGQDAAAHRVPRACYIERKGRKGTERVGQGVCAEEIRDRGFPASHGVVSKKI